MSGDCTLIHAEITRERKIKRAKRKNARNELRLQPVSLGRDLYASTPPPAGC